jgi:MFS family permease
MVAAAVALLLALSWGGSHYGWASGPILGLMGISALLWMLFVWRLMTAPEPFIPLSMVREPVVGAIVIAGFFGIGTIIGLSIFMPLYIELVLGQSASGSGLVLIAFMGGATIGSLMAGRLLSRLEHYKRVPMVGLPLGIAILAVFAIWPNRFSLSEVAALLVLGGLGMGTMYPTTTVLIQNAVPPYQLGTATGTLNFFRQLGGAIVVAVFGAIVLGGFDVHASGTIILERLSDVGGATADFAHVFRWVFIAAACFLVAAFLAVACIVERPLRGPAVRPQSAPAAAE